ncbi:MAG: hypothetical protein QXJ64_11045 [Thermosphaera sp.]
MGCTKAQLLALLTRIKKDIDGCKAIECAKQVVEYYRQLVEDHALTEAWREIVRE